MPARPRKGAESRKDAMDDRAGPIAPRPRRQLVHCCSWQGNGVDDLLREDGDADDEREQKRDGHADGRFHGFSRRLDGRRTNSMAAPARATVRFVTLTNTRPRSRFVDAGLIWGGLQPAKKKLKSRKWIRCGAAPR